MGHEPGKLDATLGPDYLESPVTVNFVINIQQRSWTLAWWLASQLGLFQRLCKKLPSNGGPVLLRSIKLRLATCFKLFLTT
ncbi:hypothetical protein V6N13_011629 [Hibiscus sabdariffa]